MRLYIAAATGLSVRYLSLFLRPAHKHRMDRFFFVKNRLIKQNHACKNNKTKRLSWRRTIETHINNDYLIRANVDQQNYI